MQVSRQIQNLPELGQSVHGIYRHGKLRFWMKSQPTSPSLLQGFENYICAKSGKNHREKKKGLEGESEISFNFATYVLSNSIFASIQ